MIRSGLGLSSVFVVIIAVTSFYLGKHSASSVESTLLESTSSESLNTDSSLQEKPVLNNKVLLEHDSQTQIETQRRTQKFSNNGSQAPSHQVEHFASRSDDPYFDSDSGYLREGFEASSKSNARNPRLNQAGSKGVEANIIAKQRFKTEVDRLFALPRRHPEISDAGYRSMLNAHLNSISSDRLLAAAARLNVNQQLVRHYRSVVEQKKQIVANTTPQSYSSSSQARAYEERQRLVYETIKRYNQVFN